MKQSLMSRGVLLGWLIAAIQWAGAVPLGAGAVTDSFPLWIGLRDGSLLRVEVEDQPISWLRVQTDGSMTERQLNLSEIERLELTLEPASEQVARVRQLIRELGHADYHIRHRAEATLITEGAPFVVLIEQAALGQDPEARHRRNRVLELLKMGGRQEEPEPMELDTLTTAADQVEGDAQDFTLSARIGEHRIELNREQLSFLTRESPADGYSPQAEVASQPVHVEHFTEPGEAFFQDGQVHVSFEEDPAGEAISIGTELEDLFIDWGLRARSETPGWSLVISNYRFMQSVSRRQSAGTYYRDEETNRTQRYLGPIEATFCQPGFEGYPAGVQAAGSFVEVVSPRHTIMEAYNSAGHRVGMVEAAKDDSSFVGLNSNDAIVRVRFLANEYLNFDSVPDQDLNEDFAIDDLCFSPSHRVTDFNYHPDYLILLKSGEFLFSKQVALQSDRIEVVDPRFESGGLSFHHDQLMSVLAPRAEPTVLAEATYVMLADGSVVRAELGESPVLIDWDNQPVDEEMLVGWWSGSQVIYPEPEDWAEQPRAVIAYPVSRILAEQFELENGQLSIAPDQLERREQNSHLQVGAPDPQVDLAETGLTFDLSESPSTWFRQPPTIDSTAGLVRLRDGQQFLLDREGGFSLDSIGDDAVTLRRGDKQLQLPWDQITVLRWP